eukprot:g3501.t1
MVGKMARCEFILDLILIALGACGRDCDGTGARGEILRFLQCLGVFLQGRKGQNVQRRAERPKIEYHTLSTRRETSSRSVSQW